MYNTISIACPIGPLPELHFEGKTLHPEGRKTALRGKKTAPQGKEYCTWREKYRPNSFKIQGPLTARSS